MGGWWLDEVEVGWLKGSFWLACDFECEVSTNVLVLIAEQVDEYGGGGGGGLSVIKSLKEEFLVVDMIFLFLKWLTNLYNYCFFVVLIHLLHS